MSYPFRPPLGVRATSDMAPLVNAEPNSSKGEIARGSHVLNGGVRVTSGKRTALGGIAPFSPFLPLPPAPTAEELRRQCNQDKNQLSEGSQMINTESEETSQWLQGPEMYQRRASSHDINEMPSSIIVENRKPTPNPAAFMIRSYSMPVATQRDFDAQLRAARLERKQRSKLAFTPAWSMSRTNSIEGDAQRSPLRTVQASEMNAISLTRTESQSRQVPKWEATNESSSPAESGTTSCSDETDVATPRAISPFNGLNSFFDVKHEDTTRALEDLRIHPDHLQPPPFMVTSS